jgi:polyphosphate kinase
MAKASGSFMSTVNVNPALLFDSPFYVSRDLSLLEFQRRVLELSRDETIPLLERLKFLAIFGSNMDEFFMLRISGIHRRMLPREFDVPLPEGDPSQELAAVRRQARELYTDALQCLHKKILPDLEQAGIHFRDYAKLSKHQKERVAAYFKKTISPLLIPLPLSYGHPFPHVSNLYLNLAIVLRDPKGRLKLMRVQIPDTLPRLFIVKQSCGKTRKGNKSGEDYYFIWLEQIIIANLAKLFPDQKVTGVHPFRIIRDAAVHVDESDAYDLFENPEAIINQLNVRRREFGPVMQVAIDKEMPDTIQALLAEILQVDPEDFYVKRNPLGLRSLWEVYNGVERPDLKYEDYEPSVPKVFKRASHPRDVFSAIRKENILLHHPYDSFSPVVEFLTFAARDPKVVAIQQTLYRIGRDSPVVKALMEASMNGKEVTAVIELKATFDEESNMGWAHLLEQAGVNVIHGLPGFKTHCKIAMVIRQEKEGLRRYVHLATGNYNTVTSHMYEDLGMFTCDQEIGEEVANLFHYLMGFSNVQDYHKVFVAPFDLRQRLEALIRREMEYGKSGFPARLIFKVNSLTDFKMIDLLYEASQAGVHIDLFVRGMCCLRPGVKGLSENISVTSIVGRYLEHSRIYYFFNGGQEQIYIGSSDLMERNLNRRIELLFPLENPEHIRYLREDVLETYLRDNQLAYRMLPDGTYKRKYPAEGDEPVNVQERLMD